MIFAESLPKLSINNESTSHTSEVASDKDNNVFPSGQDIAKPVPLKKPSIKKSEEQDHPITLMASSLGIKLIEEHKVDLIKDLIMKEEGYNAENCLQNHEIKPLLRAQMVNWMIEVFSVFQSADQAFFKAVTIMDLFYSKSIK